MIKFLLTVITAAYLVDHTITVRRIKLFGVQVESNPVVKKLATYSAHLGMLVGSFIPTVILAGVAVKVSAIALAVYTGIKADRALIQIESQKLEAKVKAEVERLRAKP